MRSISITRRARLQSSLNMQMRLHAMILGNARKAEASNSFLHGCGGCVSKRKSGRAFSTANSCDTPAFIAHQIRPVHFWDSSAQRHSATSTAPNWRAPACHYEWAARLSRWGYVGPGVRLIIGFGSCRLVRSFMVHAQHRIIHDYATGKAQSGNPLPFLSET